MINLIRQFIREEIKHTRIAQKLDQVPSILYHVTSTKNARSMLHIGIDPRTEGWGAAGEEKGLFDKTYFFTLLTDAVKLLESKLETDPMASNGKSLAFQSFDPFDYTHCIISVNSTQVKPAIWFTDPEFEDVYGGNNAIFTTGTVPASAIRVILPKRWLKVLREKVWPQYGWNKTTIDKIKMPDDD